MTKSNEFGRGPNLDPIRGGDDSQRLVDIARFAMAQVAPEEPFKFISIPFDDPEYCMTLASDLLVEIGNGELTPASTLVSEILEEGLGIRVRSISGGTIRDEETGEMVSNLVVGYEIAPGETL